MKIYLSKYARWDAPLFNVLGYVFLSVGFLLALQSLVAIYYSEPTEPFLYPAFISMLVSLPFITLFKRSKNMRVSEGLLLIVLSWVVVIFVGCVPFVMSGMSFVNAIFESASGFTTTGSTVMENLGTQPYSILMWRSASNWIGGMAVILIFMMLLPLLGAGASSVSINETQGANPRKFSARTRDIVKQFMVIYIVFTVILAIICKCLGVTMFESICIALATISTGGTIPVTSLGVYSVWVQIMVMVFMFLGGTNFYLHYRAIYGRRLDGYFSNTEFKAMAVWFTIAIALVFVILTVQTHFVEMTLEAFKDVAFTVVSLGTTTALTTTDVGVWPMAAIFILMMVMFLGGSSGSTSAGVKIYRFVLLVKYIRAAVLKTLHPRAIFDIKMDGESVGSEAVSSAIAMMMLFFITGIIGAVVVMLYGYDIFDSVSLSMSFISNNGLVLTGGFATENFVLLPDSLKIFLSVIMWMGRMEILMAMALFLPSFWKEISISVKKKKKIKSY